MKNIFSFIVVLLIGAALMQHRLTHVEADPKAPLKVTDWDCLGYYMYLPGIFIYNDITTYKWMSEIEQKYRMQGGDFYQGSLQPNGNYAGKYLCGIAIMQAPFFLAAHALAEPLGYPADGFSPPYQWSVAFAAIVWAMLGLFVLRRFLLIYYDDVSIAISLLLLCLATNLIQYAAVDSGLSHAYIFALYPLVLFTTKKWHDQPKGIYALITGFIIGFATMSRPTEAVMLFIPLMWNTHNATAAKLKWQSVRQHRSHIVLAVIGGLAGIMPQLIYWKYVTGSWIYDVGSAWDFLTPHVRVLTGWEKGWFIYTPITIFFIVGMFFMKNQPFRKSVLWFCLLNIYIIISWRDWTYGGSFSTRALVQSYPVFALPFTTFVHYAGRHRWKWLFYALGLYLVVVNFFQHDQYFKTILHYNDMNRLYCSRIYLNPSPTALDMSMLDNTDILSNIKSYKQRSILSQPAETPLRSNAGDSARVVNIPYTPKTKDSWIKVECHIKSINGSWNGFLSSKLAGGTEAKFNRVRLVHPLYQHEQYTPYAFYIDVPDNYKNGQLDLYIKAPDGYDGNIKDVTITEYSK
ncbi:MAG: hypothetical protein EOP56_02495 [Sphingobacteriales bacterium]|nr:MAG: hypothetical protein EOP56_02495 [Sphingobacteriales bacterium]